MPIPELLSPVCRNAGAVCESELPDPGQVLVPLLLKGHYRRSSTSSSGDRVACFKPAHPPSLREKSFAITNIISDDLTESLKTRADSRIVITSLSQLQAHSFVSLFFGQEGSGIEGLE